MKAKHSPAARCAVLRGRAPLANEFSGKSGSAQIPGNAVFARGILSPRLGEHIRSA